MLVDPGFRRYVTLAFCGFMPITSSFLTLCLSLFLLYVLSVSSLLFFVFRY